MITLFVYPTHWGLPNISSFCLKLETYLRLADISYERRFTTNLGRAPRGKLPFITDGETTVADSSLIIDYLKKNYGDSLDSHLTVSERAQGITLQRAVEEHLYWTMVFSRWVDPAMYPKFTAKIFEKIPAIVKWFVPDLVRKQVRKQLWEQGTGRLSADEIYHLGTQDINAFADILGSNAFLFGGRPTSFDAILYAFIENILVPPIHSPLQTAVRNRLELVAFCERMRQKAFPSATQEKDFNYQGA